MAIAEQDQSKSWSARRLRAVELAIVVVVTVWPEIVKSTLAAVYGNIKIPVSLALLLAESVTLAGSVALVAYVLSRSGRSLRDLGLRFEWRDLIRGVGIFGAALAASEICTYGTFYLIHRLTGSWPDSTARNIAWVGHVQGTALLGTAIYTIVDPIGEEIVVRGYSQTEASFLTRSPVIGMIASIALQTSYHFYQGWFAALARDLPIFAVFAVYYKRTNRLTPVVFAHIAVDLCAVLLAR